MKKPIPKSIENDIRRYVVFQKKANEIDGKIRNWLYRNNYDRAMVDMLIDSGIKGDADGFINFLNGVSDEYGYTIDDFYNDNSMLDEEDYL